MGDPDGAASMKREAAALKAQKIMYLERHGYPADYMEMKYRCPDCRDTGYKNDKKCHCFKRIEIEILYDQSNIRDVLARENFDTLSMEYYDKDRVDEKTGMTVLEYMTMIIDECKEFVERFSEEKGSILFTGSTGCGKTFLSNCIARELIQRGFSVVYLTATDMFDVLSESRFGNRDEEEAKDRAAYILDCDLLIIDDLGTEFANSFSISQLFVCLNERILRRKSTLISTNLDLDDLKNLYSERVFSRITSAYTVLRLTGDDIRIQKKLMNKYYLNYLIVSHV